MGYYPGMGLCLCDYGKKDFYLKLKVEHYKCPHIKECTN